MRSSALPRFSAAHRVDAGAGSYHHRTREATMPSSLQYPQTGLPIRNLCT